MLIICSCDDIDLGVEDIHAYTHLLFVGLTLKLYQGDLSDALSIGDDLFFLKLFIVFFFQGLLVTMPSNVSMILVWNSAPYLFFSSLTWHASSQSHKLAFSCHSFTTMPSLILVVPLQLNFSRSSLKWQVNLMICVLRLCMIVATLMLCWSLVKKIFKQVITN